MFFKQFPTETYSIEADGINTTITAIYRYVDVIEKSSANVLAYKIIEKFGCSKQTAYYYYFYRGKKALSKDRDIKFVTDRSSPKKKKTADDVVAEQLANLKKEPVSPFRI